MKKISYLLASYALLLQPLNAAMIFSDENAEHSIILDDTTSFTVPHALTVKLTDDSNGVIISENAFSKSENPFETHIMINDDNNSYYLAITPNENAFELPDNIQLINKNHSLIIFPKKTNPKKRKNNPTEEKKESKKIKQEFDKFKEPYPNCINNPKINSQLKFSYLNKILLESNNLLERQMAKAHLAEMYFNNEEPANQEPNKLMYAFIYSFIASHETHNKDAQKLAQDIYQKIINKKY